MNSTGMHPLEMLNDRSISSNYLQLEAYNNKQFHSPIIHPGIFYLRKVHPRILAADLNGNTIDLI